MFVLIGFAFDMVIATVLYIPLILLWVFYLKKKKPSPSVAAIGTFILCALYFIFAIFLFCWQCKAEDDELRSHIPHASPDMIKIIL